MITLTASQLISRTRTKADQRGDEDNTPVSDSEILSFINEGLFELVDLSTSLDSDFWRSSTDLTTDGTAFVSLPSDFWKMKHLEKKDTKEKLPLFNLEDRAVLSNPSLPAWRLVGGQYPTSQKIELYPVPSSGMVLTAHYIPELVPLESDDSFSFPQGWEEFPIVFAAIECLALEESDTSRLERRLVQLTNRITRDCHTRKPPKKLVDVRQSVRSWWN